MALNSYRFRDVWLVPAPAPAVFQAVVDLAGYPQWWPDVRSVVQIDEDTAEIVCQATLPYRLVVRMRRAEENETAGRLAVHLDGDLRGSLAARVSSHAIGAMLDIHQDVVATKHLLRMFAPVARPLFRVNHALMMRRGRRGLCARLTP
ncbi:polyketide cyclase [Amycolatopsis sp. K13G38]|uniref:Polyketide cyclase n=1 Tax=Amycolatopsis acididurans TaxID=2724524 RepID=A0ABX1JIY4_9PSEU|nr:SRPBCC family protein [Amycolatopsis acididurans]NKQ58794.1 polyketide cyclase [Amycolatopsis acididurans]